MRTRHPRVLRWTVALAALALPFAGGCRTAKPGGATRPKAATHPTDAVAYQGHWYKAFDEDISWHAAKARCEGMGGYLACIETAEEQAFVCKLAAGRYLSLGASDEKTEGEWRWVNGAPFAFTCWMGGQPNNYGGDENFLATYDGGEWVDVADDGDGFWMPTGFVCEWER